MRVNPIFLEFWVILCLAALLLILPFYLLLTALAIAYRKGVQICAKHFRPDLDQILKPFSHLFCYDALAQNCTFNICATILCEGKMSLEDLRRNFEDNILLKKHPQNERLVYPELQQSVSFFGGYPFWKWIPKFCVEDQVSSIEIGNSRNNGESTTTTPEDVRDFISGLMSKPWKSDGALLEIFLLNNYLDVVTESAQKRSLFIVRMHHCLADGYSVMNLNRCILTGGTASTLQFPKPRSKSLLDRMISPFKGVRDVVLEETLMMMATAERNPWKRPLAEMKKGFLTVWSKPGAVERIKGFKNRHGLSFQATVSAVIAGSIRRLMQAAGQSVPDYMCTMLPFPVMKRSEELNVQTIPVSIKLPLAEPCPLSRARRIQSCMERRWKSSGPLLAYSFLSTLGLFPVNINRVLSNRPEALTVTSFPAFQEPVELNGHRALSMGFAVGTHGGLTGATASILTCYKNIVFVLTVDKAIFPYESVINTLWEDIVELELDELDKVQNSSSFEFHPANV